MAKPGLVVGPLPEPEHGEWNAFVAAAPTGSIYARTDYLDALCAATGGGFRVLGARQGGQLHGGVALYEERTPFGVHVSPRLLLYYNGPVLRQHETKYPSEHTARDLRTLTALEAEIRRMGYGHVVLKPRAPLGDVRPLVASGWQARPGYTYVVGITDLGEARARVEQNLRRLIDRCDRSGFTFTADHDFDSFFALHAATMARVAFRPYLPEAAFRAYYETLAARGLAQLFQARLPDGRVAATQLVLLGHPVTHTVSAGADVAESASGVSAFLRWKVFEHLSALGYEANDLTDASLNSVTHFKSQLGGRLEPWVELASPMSPSFRWGRRVTAAARSARGAVGALARRMGVRERAGAS